MAAGFHHDKFSLGEGFQLIRRHQRLSGHLQRLAGVVFALIDITRLHGAAAQRLGQHLCCLAPGCEASEYGVLGVILYDLTTLLAVVFSNCARD